MKMSHTLTLGEACIFIRNGASISQDQSSGGIPITRIETIANGEINFQKLGYAGITDKTRYANYYLQEGDILVSHINSLSHLGKSSIFMGSPDPIIHGMNLLCLRPNENIVEPKYLFYFTKSQLFKNQLPRITNKSVNQASFKVSDLKTKISLPVTTIEEQKRTIHSLDDAYSSIRIRTETIALTDDYIKSVFLEMFGDPILNPKNWPKVTLDSFGQIITGNTPSRKMEDNYSPRFIEWIKTDNIKEHSLYVSKASEYLSELGLSRARYVSNGATLIACIAGSANSIGRAAMTDRKVSFNQQINAIQPSANTSPFFLYWMIKLSRKYLLGYASKGMKKIITKGVLQKIEMIMPPIELQESFAIVAKNVESIKEDMISQEKLLDERFRSLLQESFTN